MILELFKVPLGFLSLFFSLQITLFIVPSSCEITTVSLPSPAVCGWPSLREGGRFGPSTVRLAQRMLSNTLNKSITIDGIFSSELVADIKDFQEMHSLNVTGILNSDAWPALITLCLPLEQVA
jgi:hypothetical protein